MRHLFSLLIAVLFLTGTPMLLTGCGSDSESTTPSTDGTDVDLSSCKALAAQCKKIQQGCAPVLEEKEAHCEQCPEGQFPEGEFAQCTDIPGDKVSHEFLEATLKPGEEHSGWCRSWVLNNKEELWVNGVEFISGGYYHHSNWFFVPEGNHSYPDGELWDDCYNTGFSEVEAAINGGVLYAQSTQVMRELQKFRPGAAVRIPPYSRIIGATHVLNYSPKEQTTGLRMVLHTLKPQDVATKLTPFQFTYQDVLVPKGQQAIHESNCDIQKMFADSPLSDNQPFSFVLHYALPHYHRWGKSFSLKIHGGDDDGKSLLELGEFDIDPFGVLFEPPVDISDAKGLRFGCGWKNTEDRDLVWGLGDNEMCVMLGFAEFPMAFQGTVKKTSNVDEKADIPVSTGECEMLGFAWSHSKPGGKPADGK